MLGDVNNAKIKIDGTLILENNCTITRCADTEKAFLDGIIQGNGSVKVKSNATVGGAIDVSGNVDIQGGTVTRNIYSDGTVSLTDARLGNWVTRGNHNLRASVVDIDGESLVFGNVSGNIVTIDDGDFFGEVHGGTVTVNYARFAGEGMVRVNGDIVTVENCLLIGNTECSVSGTNVTLNGGTVTSVWGDSIMINADAVITENIYLGSDDLAKKTITINGGVVGELSLSSNCEGTICSGKISSVFLSGKLNVYGGSIGEVTGSGGLLYDYCGTALQENVKPINIVYLNCVDTKNVKGQVRGSCILQNQFIIEDGWEVQILPGATFSVSNLVNHGVYLIAGIAEGKITGNSPYYAINADSETVASVSAGDSIVRDGVTFVPEGKVVTLKSKGTGAMHWAAQPAYLNVTNNKFYMPDEVVSVKASALPLEATPAIQVNGEKLTGFTAGEYYSISDAIFRPTGTTLPIRPEWYGATVSIVKLGDGFATGDSFAQALAIPSQSSGTVTPPNPGGGTGSKPDPDDPEEIVIPDGDWEEAEEELSQADSGDTVIVETDEDDTLPDEVLESAAGKNVTLKIKVGDSIFWEIDCRVIPKDASLQDIFLQVSMNTQGIPSKVLCGLPGSHTFLQMTLGHDGLFGFPVKLHADVGRGNSGKWANLYYYNEGTGKMEFETAARVTASGDAAFTMTHASQYAIVLDEKSHTLSFQDVKEGSWFQGAVEYVYRAGLMAGTGDTTFEPNAKLTRAMTAQILYNLEGTPEVTGEATFTDMNTAPDWSVDAIAWAQDTGVVAGMGDNSFAPNLKVTREQFAQMLYNYAKYKKCDLTKAGDLTKFPDEGSVSDWAVTALSWANGNGLINGHENGTLDPQGNTVRGQAASILMNFDLNVVKSVA